MPDNKNTFELKSIVTIDIDRFTPMYNHVMSTWDEHLNDKTEGGIYVPMIDGKQAQNVVRIGTVVKNPKMLYYNRNDIQKSMLWKTDIETMVGDTIVSNHMASNDADLYEDQYGKKYRGIHYRDIDVIKRGDQIIPINGVILLKPLKYKESVLDHEVQREHKNIFEVKYVGKRNTEYIVADHAAYGKTVYREDFKYPIKPGDKVVIFKKFLGHLRKLEHEIHAKIDNREEYIVCRRYMIAGIYEG